MAKQTKLDVIDLYDDSIEKQVKQKWNEKTWLHSFRKASEERMSTTIRALRILVQETTTLACTSGKYKLRDGRVVQLYGGDQPEDVCVFHKETPEIDLSKCPTFTDTSVGIYNNDCLEVAIALKQQHNLFPAVLNMASASRPGGGYKNGAGAQEENLFRRTDYYRHLPYSYYPLPEFGGIYSPRVKVFRSSEATGYAFLENPVEMSFLAVPAYARPVTVNVRTSEGTKVELPEKIAEKTKQKIRTMLNMALQGHHDSVVLSAFGCGAYGNPPEHMAKLFHKLIYSEYAGKFKHVAFAIIDDHNARKAHNPEGNYLPFVKIFKLSKNLLIDTRDYKNTLGNNPHDHLLDTDNNHHDNNNNNGKSEIVDTNNNNNNNQTNSNNNNATAQTEEISDNLTRDYEALRTAEEVRFYRPKETFGCLSLFYACPILLQSVLWPTAEHYIQAQGFTENPEIMKEIRNAKTPNDAQRIGREKKSQKDKKWSLKEDEHFVREVMRAKFDQHPQLSAFLAATGSKPLLFESKDNYWGIGTNGKGKNAVGTILMEIRDRICQLQQSQ